MVGAVVSAAMLGGCGSAALERSELSESISVTKQVCAARAARCTFHRIQPVPGFTEIVVGRVERDGAAMPMALMVPRIGSYTPSSGTLSRLFGPGCVGSPPKLHCEDVAFARRGNHPIIVAIPAPAGGVERAALLGTWAQLMLSLAPGP